MLTPICNIPSTKKCKTWPTRLLSCFFYLLYHNFYFLNKNASLTSNQKVVSNNLLTPHWIVNTNLMISEIEMLVYKIEFPIFPQKMNNIIFGSYRLHNKQYKKNRNFLIRDQKTFFYLSRQNCLDWPRFQVGVTPQKNENNILLVFRMNYAILINILKVLFHFY